jgi:hypothetical protein
MKIDLTQDEMNLILGMFSQSQVSLLAANSITTCSMAQGIAAKFQAAVKTEPSTISVEQKDLNVTGDNVGAQIGA